MKKENRHRYPTNWTYISAYIRFERAKNKCEKCGISYGTIIQRMKNGKYHELTFSELEKVQSFREQYHLNEKQVLKKLKLTKICLVVAHLDWDESNNDYSNLLAMCQRCNFIYDKQNNVMRIKAKKWKSQLRIPAFDNS